ncbi:hypothetical protein WH95_19740 [Kiloniella litopenaei]|uniref:Uncharacterized protein n=1 Tax=Kiloniella litopenaei TaxID=1549748 RepID=A0A0M2R6Q0_9PROT|nr:hypothetical protein WH95_19740 [Kiloniella litopenaei]
MGYFIDQSRLFCEQINLKKSDIQNINTHKTNTQNQNISIYIKSIQTTLQKKGESHGHVIQRQMD